MPTPSKPTKPAAEDSQLGATDQIEQTAADLAEKSGRSRVSDQDRKNAFDQMNKTAPPPNSSPPMPDNA